MTSPLPENEADRLDALRELDILDTAPEAVYDDIVALAAAICRTEIALVNFVDADRQWGKALIGLESSEAPREISFCSVACAHEDGLLVVPDARADPRWADNPMVTGAPHLRLYAGAVISDEDGHALGTVCVADPQARELDEHMVAGLRSLARQAASHLKLRRVARQLEQANTVLRKMAGEDPLTGLANRTVLLQGADRELIRRRRSGAPLALLFCDLDGLKIINDEHGHDAGDEVLRAVARRLDRASRVLDTVARISGDEFVVLCPDLDADGDHSVIADRLAAAVAHPVTLADGSVLTPRLSIGAALAQDGDDALSLVKRADAEMYAVKTAGRI